MEKVSREIAQQEFDMWFEAKRLSESYKETYADAMEYIISNIMEGYLEVQDKGDGTYTLKQILRWPVNDMEELTYKFRLSASQQSAAVRSVKEKDKIGQIHAILGVLTGKSKTDIALLDTADQGLAQSLVVFFM